uniref:Uncharacterized protein n=1 Tax=Peronospora matthiolae TaxID=2874970 RepID=A0AAV1TZF9_9STRA
MSGRIPDSTSDARVHWAHEPDRPGEPGTVAGGEAGALLRPETAGVPDPVLKAADGRGSYAAAVTGLGARTFISVRSAPSVELPSIT